MIVICYDGSTDARAAVTQAGTLMPGHRAVVLTVWGPAGAASAAEGVTPTAQARAERTAADGALLGHQLGIDCEARTVCHTTAVADAIVGEAGRIDATAIIVGRGGGSPADTAAPGHIARAVVRDAACAVLIASPAQRQPAPAALRVAS